MIKNRRKKKDVGIYGLAAKWYDRNTRKNRLAEMREYANEVASHVGENAKILEVAPGPGYLAIELPGTFLLYEGLRRIPVIRYLVLGMKRKKVKQPAPV